MKRDILRVFNVLAFGLLTVLMLFWVIGDKPVRDNPEVFFNIWIFGPIMVLGWCLSSLMVWIDRLITKDQSDV